MLGELMDGRALTATELARVATISRQTASSHLGRLVSAGLLNVNQQGRHRYHRLSGPHIARMLEGIMQIASINEPGRNHGLVVGPRDAALRAARTCYDHLAGRLGVAISDRLIALGAIEFDDDAGVVTEEGARLLGCIGIELPDCNTKTSSSSRPLCRPCLDWSERRPHIAGKLGAAICVHCLENGWIRRRKGTRALEVTPKGRAALRDVLGIY
jgi:predicted transcriptional regulator